MVSAALRQDMETVGTRRVVPYAAARRIDVPGSFDTVDLSTIGGRVSWARAKADLTQKQLAIKLDKSRATIVQYEANNIVPPLDMVEKLADALGVEPEFLAFGKHGINGLAAGVHEIVVIPQMTSGKDGEYASGAMAVSAETATQMGIDRKTGLAYSAQSDSPAFDIRANDILFVNSLIKAIDSSHDLYLLRTPNGTEIVRVEPSLTKKASLTFTSGKGRQVAVTGKELDVIGAIVGTLRIT